MRALRMSKKSCYQFVAVILLGYGLLAGYFYIPSIIFRQPDEPQECRQYTGIVRHRAFSIGNHPDTGLVSMGFSAVTPNGSSILHNAFVAFESATDAKLCDHFEGEEWNYLRAVVFESDVNAQGAKMDFFLRVESNCNGLEFFDRDDRRYGYDFIYDAADTNTQTRLTIAIVYVKKDGTLVRWDSLPKVTREKIQSIPMLSKWLD